MIRQPDSSVVFKTLMDHMNEIVWMTDKNERTVYMSPRLAAIIECPIEEMIGKSSYRFFDKDTLKKVRWMDAHERKKGITSSYEGVLIGRKTGKKTPVLISGSPLPGGGTIGIMTDLTPVKRQEDLYRNLVEHMNEAVWMGDDKERTVYANPKFCSLVGYALDEIIGWESYKFWDEESARRVKHVNIAHRRKGQSSSYEGMLVSKTGKKIPVLLSGTPTADGGTIGIITDLTSFKQKEQRELILSRALLLSSDGIIVVDEKGRIETWNKGAKVMFGYREADIVGKTVGTLFPDIAVTDFLGNKSIDGSHELRARHKNGHVITVALTISPVRTRKANDLSAILIMRDATATRKFEEELTVKYQKLKDSYHFVGTLRRHIDYMAELAEIAATCTDAQELFDFIVNATVMLTKVDACVLRVLDEQKKKLHLASSFGVGNDWQGKATIPLAKSLIEKAFSLGTPLKVIDIMREPRYTSPQLAKKNDFTSMLVIPLVFQKKLLASISLYMKPHRKLDLFESDFLEDFAKAIALSLSSTTRP